MKTMGKVEHVNSSDVSSIIRTGDDKWRRMTEKWQQEKSNTVATEIFEYLRDFRVHSGRKMLSFQCK